MSTTTAPRRFEMPLQIQKQPAAELAIETEMELTDDELEAVVGGLARTLTPTHLFPAAA